MAVSQRALRSPSKRGFVHASRDCATDIGGTVGCLEPCQSGRHQVSSNAHGLWNWRGLAWLGLAALLAWQAVAQSLAAYLAEVAPTTSLWLHPRQPSALVELADQAFDRTNDAFPGKLPERSRPVTASRRGPHPSERTRSAADASLSYVQALNRAFSAFETVGRNQSSSRPIAPANAPSVRRWLRSALANDPLNEHALRRLGELAEANGDDDAALKFMRAAARLSLHDSFVTLWLMRKNAQTGDDKSAIYYANVLLRTTPELGANAMPLLAHLAGEKSAHKLLTAVLARDPPWRGQFFAALPNYVTDARIPLQLLVGLRGSAAPPSRTEVAGYINFLVARKFYELAYYTWLQFLPAEELRNAGFLFNGDFNVKPSGSPFDWQITSGSGVTVDIVPRPGKAGAHALMVDFEFGRVGYQSVREFVMLAPGPYEFRAEYKGQLIGRRGLKWRVTCDNGVNTRIGESPMIIGIAKDWKPVTFGFTVPASGCRAQIVSLDLDARMASEQFISGSMLFDALNIARIANPS